MTLRLNGTTSGYTEIDSAAIGNNNLLTLPTTTAGTLIAANSSGVVQMNSGYGSNANAYGCSAWVNFNGKNTVAIRASGNVSSITDNGTGLYTLNFTTAMPDANYMVTGSTVGNSQNEGQIVTGSNNLSSQSTSSVQLAVMYCANGSRNDVGQVNVAIFR